MAEVSLSINGRSYQVACQDGEEDQLRSLASEIDQHVRDLAAGVGQVGDSRLLLMAALMVADQNSELKERLNVLERDVALLRERESASDAVNAETEEKIATALDMAADRIQRMAARLGDQGTAGAAQFDGILPLDNKET